jgi:phage terminase large subunit GpA-like protein
MEGPVPGISSHPALFTAINKDSQELWCERVPFDGGLAQRMSDRAVRILGTPTAVDVTVGGKRLRRGVKVFAVAGGIAKLELYNNLRKTVEVGEDGELHYPAGFVHLPKVDAEFVQQLCAEQLVTRRDRNGFPVREWQKLRERNEGLDCYQYSRAAAAASGLDRFEERHWRELERSLGIEVNAPAQVPPREAETIEQRARSATSPTRRRVIKSRWLS